MSYIVLFDLDDTLIEGQSQKILAKYLFKKKKINLFFLIYIYSWFFLYKTGLIKDVIRIREKSFQICKGWSLDYMRDLLNNFLDSDIKPLFYKDILDIVKFHKKKGATLVLISASLFPLVKLVSEYLDFDFVFATKLEVKGGLYTGNIDGEVVYGKNKKRIINNLINDNNLDFKDSYCYTDHYSDMELLETVDNPVVINPDKKLSEFALLKKWEIKKIKIKK